MVTGTVPLIEAPAGQPLIVRGVSAGGSLRARLAAMGLLPGVQLEIVHQPSQGYLIVRIREARLSLGRGMANRIMVAPVSPTATDADSG